MGARRVVVAIGGNALIRDAQHQTVQDQYEMAAETDHRIAALVRAGMDVAITHGNGPQVGYILRRSELAAHELHEVPLEFCVADTQGAIGYTLQQTLQNDFRRLDVECDVATIVTQIEVDPNDPAFEHPTKPIGWYLDEPTAKRRRAEGWQVVHEEGQGWRRVVPSPTPLSIVEARMIRRLADSGFVVIAAGGGGIPVVREPTGRLRGVEAVIDKDLAAALLAGVLDADLLAITTSVEKVALYFGTADEQWLDRLTLEEAKRYLAEGVHFEQGSMEPKVRAVVNFLEAGGEEAVITDSEHLVPAVAGETGTRFVR